MKYFQPILLILLFCSQILTTGCTVYYGVADFSSEAEYTPKPFVQDSARQQLFYAGGSYYRNNVGYGGVFTSDVQVDLVNLTFGTTVAEEGYYYSYGGLVNYGNYIEDGKEYDFYGGGINTEVGLVRFFGKGKGFNVKPGIKTVLQYEDGSYGTLRKSINDEYFGEGSWLMEPLEGQDAEPNGLAFSGLATVEFSYRLDENIFSVYSAGGITSHGLIGAGGISYNRHWFVTRASCTISPIGGVYYGGGVSFLIQR
ncbi:hypothetical protein [Reichenbachiella ulvae]|uniref:Outer membrane protein beta-barrel domain-containing protein n=1 Tax=Reichenbachiella ulvae TaxID=2980104 RepID=A0ABT3CWP9_9BACT|nr:hypothetical protein [Reichenbachiella ulvae]MCV9387983.1 hypothetical protein [Reichenbachiella ulvae]